jgi:hypothetical protein
MFATTELEIKTYDDLLGSSDFTQTQVQVQNFIFSGAGL